jgi:hypothetical protein
VVQAENGSSKSKVADINKLRIACKTIRRRLKEHKIDKPKVVFCPRFKMK